MAQTEALQNLLMTPPDSRSLEWYKNFESALLRSGAPQFDSASPQLFQGPDGLQYWHLSFPVQNPAHDFKSFIAAAAEHGCGIVLDLGGSHYVLHYGDVWSLHEYGYFFKSREEAVAEEVDTDETNNLSYFKVSKATRIIIGCPSDHYLPPYVKKSIAARLAEAGIDKAGVASVYIRDLHPRQNLVFSIKESDFPSRQDYQKVMQTLAWSIPKHYGLLWNEVEDDRHSYLVPAADFYPLV